MTASALPVPAAVAALSRFVDYAGLFPPAQLDIASAAAEYVRERSTPASWVLGRFIVRQSQLSKLLAAIPPGEQFPVSLILDGGIGDLEWAAGFRRDTRRAAIEALEVALSPAAVDDFAEQRRERGMDDVPAYVETTASALPRLSQRGLGAKIRCGGVTADAYPTPDAVAEFIEGAVRHGVPFKATAGLHHPVRHYNRAAGVKMHGFLNLLAATALACEHAPAEDVERAIACEEKSAFDFDADGFRYRNRVFHHDAMKHVRAQAFIAYGSCSFSEPVEDLQGMGVLP